MDKLPSEPVTNDNVSVQSTTPASYSHLGPLSPGATDRVFPVRSVVSVDPTQTPFARSETGVDGFPGLVPLNHHEASSPHSIRQGPKSSSIPAVGNDSMALPSANPINQLNARSDASSLKNHAPPSVTLYDRRLRGASTPIKADLERARSSQQTATYPDSPPFKPESNHSAYRSANSMSGAGSVRSVSDDGHSLMTTRFKHVVNEGDHAVVTGRDGDVIQRCEDEPIHTPGAIQSFGLLVALQEGAEGKLILKVVSENSKQLIGYDPRQLFALDSFCDILSDEQTGNLMDHLEFIKDEEPDTAQTGPEVFTLSIRSPNGKMQKLWCAMHIHEKHPEIIICEFELEDDRLNPLISEEEALRNGPEDTLNSNPTEDELAESTNPVSKPLRVLRSARKRRDEAAAMEVLNILSQVQEQLAGAPDLTSFLKILVGVVKELTGFHRVMVYQFDGSWNGRVVTELVDPRATKDLYKGLNFPASDIPRQARELYKVNKVRLLYDRDQETARLVCRSVEDLETPLDLTYAYLRAMSPIHIKYLANMAVRASMSISIIAFNELWGLIALHAYGTKGMRVSFPIRKMSRLVGESASRNIERLSYASRLQARKLINTAPTEHNPSGYIIASSDDLLQLFDADYGLLSIGDGTKILGDLENAQEALALLEYLRLRKLASVTTSNDIIADFSDLRYPPGFSVIRGLLLVPLSAGGNNFIVFFRKGHTREVKWAGNPYLKFVKQGTSALLEPRTSFKAWSEKVVYKSREWTEEQIETAAVLCLVYGKFIEVWRQKEMALHNTQLTKLLLSNSAHEVRTPLNAIINYLEIALEGPLDLETRSNLERSHTASKSLIYVINDLLDLTKIEQGNNLIKNDVFDLLATVKEATDMFKGDAKRKQLDYQVTEHPGVPQYVIGDQRKVRQAISNVTANAIQHTHNGAVKIELWLAEEEKDRVAVDFVVQDTGIGMSSKKLDALFEDLEQVQSEDDDLAANVLGSDSQMVVSKGPQQRTLGLGLALVARIVRNMNGQLRLKSEEGKGSRFVIQLGFELPGMPPKINIRAKMEETMAPGVAPAAVRPKTPPVDDGEVMLISKSGQRTPIRAAKDLIRRSSNGSLYSLRSRNSIESFQSGSSVKSEVDRLIEAIQEPQMRLTQRRGSWADDPSSVRTGRVSTPRSRMKTPMTGTFSPIHRVQPMSIPSSGHVSITSARTPVKAIRVTEGQDGGIDAPSYSSPPASKMTFNIHDAPTSGAKSLTSDNLCVLVAEDDPINSKIVKKRLEKLGHKVHLTINGEECFSVYNEKPAFFDVVLMDMQVRMIQRSFRAPYHLLTWMLDAHR